MQQSKEAQAQAQPEQEGGHARMRTRTASSIKLRTRQPPWALRTRRTPAPPLLLRAESPTPTGECASGLRWSPETGLGGLRPRD